MTYYDAFNGDADGICALIQLRLADPRDAVLVTGVKRDIDLLKRIDAQSGDAVTALDINMRSNAPALMSILDKGASVFFVDHHNPGDIIKHDNLTAIIDKRPNICTGLLVDKYLNGAYREWAVMAAFGDNMKESATAAAQGSGLSAGMLATLKEFGELLNYNAYGRDLDDLHFKPADLYTRLAKYTTPTESINAEPEIFNALKDGFAADMDSAANGDIFVGSNSHYAVGLADAKWARRVSGSLGNSLAQAAPERVHAVLTHNAKGGYTVSIRAPKSRPEGADTFCLGFETGGGRAAAAGINHLPQGGLDDFLARFKAAF